MEKRIAWSQRMSGANGDRGDYVLFGLSAESGELEAIDASNNIAALAAMYEGVESLSVGSWEYSQLFIKKVA